MSNRNPEEDIYLHYNQTRTQKAKENILRDLAANFKAPEEADYVCCTDVWGGFCQRPKTGTERECSSEETYEINFFKVFAKQLTSLILFGLVVWFVYVVQSTGDRETVRLFDCDPESDTSFIAVDGVINDFNDEGVQYCYFKNTMIFVSFGFIYPYILETFSVVTVIWVSSINREVLVPVVDGKYVGYGRIFDGVHSPDVFTRSFSCLAVIGSVPYEILTLNKAAAVPVPTILIAFEMAWKLVVFMVPDLLLTASLFLVSYYVMISSDTPEDILVNLVAVQVFAELDDVFVKMLFSPRNSCGERVLAYTSANQNADKAKYEPFIAYSMNESRHEMGIKVKDKNEHQMQYFHDYSGHHLATH